MPSFKKNINKQTTEMITYLKADLTEYTGREVRHEEDALRALLGVLTYYAKKVFTISGVCRSLNGVTIHNPQPESAVVLNLDCYRPTPGVRRQGFPSWSWAGWTRAIDWISQVCCFDRSCSIAIESIDGETVPIGRLEWSQSLRPE